MEHATCLGQLKMHTEFQSEKLKGGNRLDRPRRRQNNNTEINLKEICCQDVDQIYLPQDNALEAVESFCEHGN